MDKTNNYTYEIGNARSLTVEKNNNLIRIRHKGTKTAVIFTLARRASFDYALTKSITNCTNCHKVRTLHTANTMAEDGPCQYGKVFPASASKCSSHTSAKGRPTANLLALESHYLCLNGNHWKKLPVVGTVISRLLPTLYLLPWTVPLHSESSKAVTGLATFSTRIVVHIILISRDGTSK